MPKAITRRWFSMKAETDAAEISIFDEIGGWGVTVSDFKREFDAIKDKKAIRLLLNSPGGNVFDGMAIYNILLPLREKIDVDVVGLAASIASIVALAGKSLRVMEGAYYMIHDPWTLAVGTGADMRKTADLLDQIGGTMADIYAARTGIDRMEILSLMADETWMTAEEAVERGFADEALEGEAIAALAGDVSKYGFRHAPEALVSISKKPLPPMTPRDLEALLRDGGYSATTAKGIVAEGFSAVHAGRVDEPDAGTASNITEAAAVVARSILEDIRGKPPEKKDLELTVIRSGSKTRARIRAVEMSISNIIKE